MTEPRTSANDELDASRMGLEEHLEELRWRILYAILGLAVATAVCLIFAPRLIEWLKGPYVAAMNSVGLEPDLAVLDVSAGLKNYLKVSIYAGLVIASPWVFYQFWAFVAAGLYERERRYVHFAAPACAGLFIAGATFFVLVVARPVLSFLLGLTVWLGMTPIITFDSHIGFMARMMVVFGLAFQTPLLILLLRLMDVVSMAALHHYRRHVIVGIFLMAAIFTPPDPLSQLAMAIPMWLLYELGIVLSWIFVRRNRT
jgi:sec-independent protein translocase protein TatC